MALQLSRLDDAERFSREAREEAGEIREEYLTDEFRKECEEAGFDYAVEKIEEGRRKAEVLGAASDLAQGCVEDPEEAEVAVDWIAEGIRKAFAESERPICEVCERAISDDDIEAYRLEAGSDREVPATCTDCAEDAAR
jgi:hypothetical protein